VPGFGRFDRIVFMTPFLEVAFKLKPALGMETTPPPSPDDMPLAIRNALRLRLTVRVPEDSPFHVASRAWDELILDQAFTNMKAWLTAEKLSKAKNDKSKLGMAQAAMVKAGSLKEDGVTSYEPNFSVNLDGWGAYISAWTLTTSKSKDGVESTRIDDVSGEERSGAGALQLQWPAPLRSVVRRVCR
jgi:hypothetical protein